MRKGPIAYIMDVIKNITWQKSMVHKHKNHESQRSFCERAQVGIRKEKYRIHIIARILITFFVCDNSSSTFKTISMYVDSIGPTRVMLQFCIVVDLPPELHWTNLQNIGASIQVM